MHRADYQPFQWGRLWYDCVICAFFCKNTKPLLADFDSLKATQAKIDIGNKLEDYRRHMAGTGHNPISHNLPDAPRSISREIQKGWSAYQIIVWKHDRRLEILGEIKDEELEGLDFEATRRLVRSRLWST